MAPSACIISTTFSANTACTRPANIDGETIHFPSSKQNTTEIAEIDIQHIASLMSEIPGVKKLKEIMSSKVREYDQIDELIMIDVIQRLGLEYYFQEEIYDALGRHFATCSSTFEDGDDNLYKVSLRFRLLRQGGHAAPVEIFENFKDNDGKFKQELRKDEKGLLSLLEASLLSIQGEDIMDEAGEFCEQQLKFALMNIIEQPARTRIIENTLRNFVHKISLPRLFPKSSIEDFNVLLELLRDSAGMKNWINHLQDLAMFDFAMSKMTQKHELQQIFRWVKEINSSKQLDFARIDPIKWYVWILGTLPGPNLGEERIEVVKSASFLYIIDDIFDVHGTPNELSLFTEAIHRWDEADTEQLPDYMKVCFKALRDVVNNICHKVHIKHGWNPKHLLQNMWADLCNAFLMEAKWAGAEQLPTTAEYLKNGIISSGVPVFLGLIFCLLGEGSDNKSKDFLNNLPSIITSTAAIARLSNDVGRHKVEDRDGHDMSYVDCYMNEQKVSSIDSATKHVNQMISNSLKDLNEEILSQTSPFSAKFREVCLNIARMVPIMYGRDESHRAHCRSLKKHLKSLLNDDSKMSSL